MDGITIFGIFLSLLPLIIFIGIFVAIIVFIVSVVKRFERRADERLALEKENTNLLQSKLNGIDERLSTIEKMLKDVE
ncbi:hypothetical protein [Psychrobacillus lasiicapitis]|uniref:DUF4083 domain-containing protein n=1 Tax=Psychrobacillus lasiicapitis TaxID=1636719 RepID=A0A544SVF6_9BACI|nr:hypothetical protein [Psychrobacillus lasiicapitis]TQR09195.1 hypothetical protein FG382_20585 [Psychrobacillus lasiicapitis]GGA48285.1 hypothetical protein GCM10011384_42500 [Psychrobacillus lasiicapitis]